jgi:hypothetical protein
VQEGGAAQIDTLTLGNLRAVDLDWTWQDGGSTELGYSQLRDPVQNPGSGFSTGFYTGNGGNGVFMSDAFILGSTVDIQSILVDGFVFAATPADAYQEVTFHIFPDAGGVPAGDPQSSPELAVWSWIGTIGDPGLVVDGGAFGGSISLDLIQAGEALELQAGKYWLVAAPIVGATGAPNTDEWFWLGTGADANRDDVGMLIDPGNLFGAGITSWSALEPLLSPPNNVRFRGLAFAVSAPGACGAPWLSVDPIAGTVAPSGSAELTVTFDPTGLTPGVYETNVCIASNDTATPVLSVPATFTVEAPPTDPTAIGAASPDVVVIGGTSVLTVEVTPGQNPTSTGIAVTADLTDIGGDSAQVFVDDGSGDDAVAGDNIFTLTATIGAATTPGAVSLPVSVIDDQARTAVTSIALTAELAPTDPTAIGAASPDVVLIGGSSIFTVEVTPGQNPTSTGIVVTADLTDIGGESAQAFVDDGSGDDAVAGDNIFTFTATIGAATTPGDVNLPVSVLDDQARTAAANIALSAQPADDFIFGDGFETD